MEAAQTIDPLITRALPGSIWESVSPGLKDWDEGLRSKIMSWHDANSFFWQGFSWLSENPLGIAFSFLVFLGILWLAFGKTPTTLKYKLIVLCSFVVLSLLSDLFASFLKEFFGRLKPHVTFVNQFWYQKSEYMPALSLPSNHALNTAFQCFCLWSFLRSFSKNNHTKLLLCFLLPLCLLVGYSRIVLGQHYFLDVVVGLLIGSLLGFTSGRILARFKSKLI